MARQFVCKRDDIEPNEMYGFDLTSGARVVILRVDDRFYACNRECPHQEVNLDEGIFDGKVLTCTQHLWQWNVTTGEPVGLAECALSVYKVEVDGDAVFVDPDVTP